MTVTPPPVERIAFEPPTNRPEFFTVARPGVDNALCPVGAWIVPELSIFAEPAKMAMRAVNSIVPELFMVAPPEVCTPKLGEVITAVLLLFTSAAPA